MSNGPCTRRQILRGAAITAAVVAATSTPVTARAFGGPPRRRDGVTTFVFVAGASGSAASDDELVLRGHRTVGVRLPGHDLTDNQYRRSYQAPQDLAAFATEPSPMAGVTLDDFVEATVKVVRRAADHGPVILVGGSQGGVTLSRVGNEIPHLIDRLVYTSAFCCVELPSVADYLQTPEAEGTLLLSIGGAAVGDPAVLGASRVNWRTADPTVLAQLKEAMMAEATDAEFYGTLNFLQPDEAISVPLEDARGHRDTWGRIPRTYIRHTRDRCIPVALQDRMIAEADRLTPRNRFDVRSVATSHAPHRAGWQQIVEILDGLAQRR